MSVTSVALWLVGDVHAGPSNHIHVEKLFHILNKSITKARAERKTPDAIVFMGDLLDGFRKVDLETLASISHHLIELSKFTRIVIIVGNHDRANALDFQSNVHPFVGLSQVEDIYVFNKAAALNINKRNDKGEEFEYRFVFVPYVAPGRFADALATLNTPIDKKRPLAIFCHQEFRGVSLGPHKSEKGDEWPLDAPMIYSGHIHEHHYLQPNICYVGTPYQVTVSESLNKVMMIVRWYQDKLDEPTVSTIRTNISNKRNVSLRVGDNSIPSFTEECESLPSHAKRQIKIHLYHGESERENMDRERKKLIALGFTNVHPRVERDTPQYIKEKIESHKGDTFSTIFSQLLKENPRAFVTYNQLLA